MRQPGAHDFWLSAELTAPEPVWSAMVNLVLLFLSPEGRAMEIDGCVGKVVERILLRHELGPQTIEVWFKDGTTLTLNLAQRVAIEVSLDDRKSEDDNVTKKPPKAA